VLAAAFAVACGGGGDEGANPMTAPSSVASPTSEPEPTTTISAQPSPGSTGIDSIDAIARAVRSGNAQDIADLVVFRQVACTTNIQGIGGPPACRQGEAEGTEVLVIFGASCEGYYARGDELPFRRVALGDSPLYAVFRIDAGTQLARTWPDAKYAVVLNRVVGEAAADLAFALLADDEGIVGFSESCGETPERWVAVQGLTDAVVAPMQ
jgi:hypothetical protein